MTIVSQTGDVSVLVVDDETRYAEAHARMISDEYSVETAYSGQEAVETITDEFDVLVIDRNMPTLSGDDVAAAVRDRNLDCRIIMITAVEPNLDIVDLGIDDYLTKPVSEDELKETIDNALEWAEYDDTLRDYFALSNKREVLLEEGEDIEDTEEFSEIEKKLMEAAEQGLQKSEEVLQTLIQSSPAAIVTLDEAGKIDIWNQSAREMFGWEQADIRGEDPPMFTTDAEARMQDIRAKLFGEATVTDIHVKCVTANDTRLDISLSASPLYDAEGNMYGTMFLMTDISERKQRAQRLNVMSRVLRHNIRNELNIVLGRVQLVRDTVPEEQRKHLDQATEGIHELLDLSEKAKSVQQLLDDDPDDQNVLDVGETLENVVSRVHEEYGDVTVRTVAETDADAVISAEGFYRVLWELLENAIQHNDSDEPAVEVKRELEETSDGELLAIRVSDDGPGIPADEIAVVERGEEDALSHGSGIGLWTVRWIVDQSGGEIQFDDSDLGGTEVSILLPIPDGQRTV